VASLRNLAVLVAPLRRWGRRSARLACILLGVMLFAAVAQAGRDTDLTPVSFLPQWQPQAQFAGYYVAFEKGFYRQHGLEMTILAGGPERLPSVWLSQGRADFGTLFLAAGIERRAQGLKLVNIAQIVQRSALMLVAKKSSGINTPADMNGKKVGLWPAELRLAPQAFFRENGVQVKMVPQSKTLNLFLRGGVDVGSAMWYNEYHQLLNSGVNPEELITFLLADYGMNFPEDGIYCLEDLVQRQPRVCRAFVAASVQGWQYAFDHPDETLDIVMRYVEAANVASDRVHQQWMLARLKEMIQPPGPDIPMGFLRQATYDLVANELEKSGMIKHIPKFGSFYRDLEATDAP
jgi:NitT/TauT family transport system substrate-binding protein